MDPHLSDLTGRIRTDYVWAISRILLGWLFFWTFLDKTFGLGYSTASKDAWLNGGSPTEGYLNYAVSGVFEPLFSAISGNALVDVLFMIGMFFIGSALILGIGMRLAGIGGTLMLILLWATNVPPVNNPLIDQHIVFIFLLIGLVRIRAGNTLGLGEWWNGTPLVRRFPILA